MELTIGDLKRILSKYSDDTVVVDDFGTSGFGCLLPVRAREDSLVVKEHQDLVIDGKPTVEVMWNFRPDNETLDPNCD